MKPSPDNFSEEFNESLSNGIPTDQDRLPMLYKYMHDFSGYLKYYKSNLIELTETIKTGPAKIKELEAKIIDLENSKSELMTAIEQAEGFPSIEL